jgi:uncharacterized membrane protein (UPF0127 family)
LHIGEFAEALENVTESARFLASLNVLDVEFSSGHVLELYIANNQEQRSRGLSRLSSLDTDGMMFYYDSTSYRPFTMAEMQFDLDIAWYDEKGYLLDVASFESSYELPVYAKHGFRYAIETPKGVLPFSDLKVR